MDNEMILNEKELVILLSAMHESKNQEPKAIELYNRLEKVFVSQKINELHNKIFTDGNQDLEFHKLIKSLRNQKPEIEKAISEIDNIIKNLFEK